MHRVRAALLLLLAATLSFCAKREARAPTTAAKSLTIAVVPQGTTHEFWKSIHAGALKAARDSSSQGVQVNLIWKGPVREDDREQQVQVVEGFLTQGVSGIVLAPFDKNALVRRARARAESCFAATTSRTATARNRSRTASATSAKTASTKDWRCSFRSPTTSR